MLNLNDLHQAAPVALAINNTRASIPNIMIANSGSQRFDIYAGSFTKNDQLTASPFADSFLFIPNVPFSIANQVLPALNHAGTNNRRELLEERERTLYGRGHVDMVYNRWLEEQDRRDGVERRAAQNLTLGYVTQDVRSFFILYHSFSKPLSCSTRLAQALEMTFSMPLCHSSPARTLSVLSLQPLPTMRPSISSLSISSRVSFCKS